ncbi:MAG TPA: hypothetical protein VNP04_23405 [Alphaproteobacteria bacterium]|nr:hypothetical protein [Alphaproteobacteria bacterium]
MPVTLFPWVSSTHGGVATASEAHAPYLFRQDMTEQGRPMANGLGVHAHQQVAVAARRRCGGGWE